MGCWLGLFLTLHLLVALLLLMLTSQFLHCLRTLALQFLPLSIGSLLSLLSLRLDPLRVRRPARLDLLSLRVGGGVAPLCAVLASIIEAKALFTEKAKDPDADDAPPEEEEESDVPEEEDPAEAAPPPAEEEEEENVEEEKRELNKAICPEYVIVLNSTADNCKKRIFEGGARFCAEGLFDSDEAAFVHRTQEYRNANLLADGSAGTPEFFEEEASIKVLKADVDVQSLPRSASSSARASHFRRSRAAAGATSSSLRVTSRNLSLCSSKTCPSKLITLPMTIQSPPTAAEASLRKGGSNANTSKPAFSSGLHASGGFGATSAHTSCSMASTEAETR